MRAIDMVTDELFSRMNFMHKARRESLLKAVAAAITGRKLTLTDLGRARASASEEGSPRHGIKAADRLLGSEQLSYERDAVSGVLARFLVRRCRTPIVLVDSVEIRPGLYALVAALAFDGRAFPIYSTLSYAAAVPKRICRGFLQGLERVLPSHCTPILVTDAGFEGPWLELIEDIGWEYVARQRGVKSFELDGTWTSAKELYQRASNRPRNLGISHFPKKRPRPRRLVLSKRRRSAGRKRRTRAGDPGARRMDGVYGRTAREPWLLATSLPCAPEKVVEIYALRMQIEESFRDAKNHRWGWSLRACGSRSPDRLLNLLLIAALACVAQQLVGIAGERAKLHHRHQANTERGRRVLSLFVLGGLILRGGDHRRLHERDLHAAIRATVQKIGTLGRGYWE